MVMVSRSQLLAKGGFLLIVGTLARVGADAGGAELSEGLGELVAQPLIVLGQFPVAGGGGLQPAEQGCVAAAVTCRQRRPGCPAAEVAQPEDLATDVGLGVEPG